MHAAPANYLPANYFDALDALLVEYLAELDAADAYDAEARRIVNGERE